MNQRSHFRLLPENPDLDQLKRQAKELLRSFRDGNIGAGAMVNAHYHGADSAKFALHDAQLVIARSYGFESWPKLKAYVDGMTIKRLAAAVQGGNLEQTRAMLKTRPELANMQMSYGDEHRPLHFAVMNRSADIVRLLMQHGADARAGINPHRDATSALTIAIERGYDDIAAIIQDEEHRQRRARSSSALTATSAQDDLSQAISRGDESRAFATLEADPALVDGCDRDGWTPLHRASAVHNTRLVSWLLDHGARVNQRGSDGRTPIDLAAAAGRPAGDDQINDIIEMLRRAGAELTPAAAVALGDADWLRVRHAEGTLVNQIDWNSGGLLTVAVKHNRPGILEMLLDFGFDPDERIRFGEGGQAAYSQTYPLWHCAALGRPGMAEMLIRRGASLTQHVDSSGSPIHSAYSHRQWGMVELFKRLGGVVGADTAALYRETELARQMIADEDRGVLPAGTVSPGRILAEDLLEFAASGGDPEIVRMALERIDWPSGDDRWFRYLARCLDFWNHIPWLYAANHELDRSTYIDCFRQVLDRSGPNVIGGFGRTPLHEAAAADDHITGEEAAAFARLLLTAGARADMRDDILLSTPLGWACRWGRLEVARLLLEAGADPVEADAEPWARPRAWAGKMGHTNILEVLTTHGG